MKPQRSDHNPATDPPGAVSNQNGEENPSEHREDETHPEPRTTGRKSPQGDHQRDHERDDERPSGAAGEGSQSTGHPQNAG